MNARPLSDAELDAADLALLRGGRALATATANNRGRSVLVSPRDANGAIVVGQTRAVILETPKENGEGAESIAVTLGVAVQGTLAEPVDLVARLTWGAGGAFYAAEVDWQNGRVIVLQATNVKVEAVYTTVASLSGEPPRDLMVSASFAYGASSRANGATRTTRVPQLAASGPGDTSALFPIPAFATTVQVMAAESPHTLSVFFFSDASGLRPAIGSGKRTQSSNCGGVIIPNGSAFITVRNDDIGNPAHPCLVFGLDI